MTFFSSSVGGQVSHLQFFFFKDTDVWPPDTNVRLTQYVLRNRKHWNSSLCSASCSCLLSTMLGYLWHFNPPDVHRWPGALRGLWEKQQQQGACKPRQLCRLRQVKHVLLEVFFCCKHSYQSLIPWKSSNPIITTAYWWWWVVNLRFGGRGLGYSRYCLLWSHIFDCFNIDIKMTMNERTLLSMCECNQLVDFLQGKKIVIAVSTFLSSLQFWFCFPNKQIFLFPWNEIHLLHWHTLICHFDCSSLFSLGFWLTKKLFYLALAFFFLFKSIFRFQCGKKKLNECQVHAVQDADKENLCAIYF